MTLSDVDLFENNEAFAVSNLLFNSMLGVPHERLNVNGGAIVLGHPIGASRTRLVVTLVNALKEQNTTLGIASICHESGGEPRSHLSGFSVIQAVFQITISNN
jgi:acetyl-CoA C-acetyltransferase